MHLYGKHPIAERLRAAPHTIQTIYLLEGKEASVHAIVTAARKAHRPVQSLSPRAFTKKAGDVHAQGILADVDAFNYASFESLIDAPASQPTLLLLDRVTDPQNLGNIIRTVACLGYTAIILPKHDSVDVTSTVLRIASGGENYVPIARVTNLVRAAEQAKDAGYWIAGAVTTGGTAIHEVSWPQPVGIVLGPEDHQIRPGLRNILDLLVTLPMHGAHLSFNVSTAAALLIYDITRARSTT